MKTLTLSISFLLLSVLLGYGQKKSTEYNWENTKLTTSIPDSMLTEDAVCIYNLQEIRNRSGRLSYFVYKTRIKILTQQGLEQFASFAVRRPNYSIINTIDARTIKSDGSIVDFNSSDIKVLDLKYNKNTSIKLQLLSAPGVEVGDEIEFVYIYQYDNIVENEDIFLHREIPVMSSIYKHTLDNVYAVDYRLYNKMPSPILDKKETESTYYWELKNLPGTSDNENGIMQESIPFIRYSVLYGFGKF